MTEAKKESTAALPPYIPWKTFGGYLASLKNTTVPHVLDPTTRPRTMAGGLWSQLTSALQFLGLIDQNKVVKDAFGKLVKAHGSPDWKKAVGDAVVPAYASIIDGVPLERASSGQIAKAFKDRGRVDGQMADKAIRFYLHALREAGIKYSDLLALRADKGGPRKVGKTKQKAKGPAPESGANAASDGKSKKKKSDHEDKVPESPPEGTTAFPLPFKGKIAGVIQVPDDMSAEDVKLFELMVAAVKGFAAQK